MSGEEKPVSEGHDVDAGERAVSISIQEVFSSLALFSIVSSVFRLFLFFLSFPFKILFSGIRKCYKTGFTQNLFMFLQFWVRCLFLFNGHLMVIPFCYYQCGSCESTD